MTFGIKPTHPKTGYGYLELKTAVLDEHGTSELVSFVEKPNVKHAKKMLGAGNFFGMRGYFCSALKKCLMPLRHMLQKL